MLGEGPASPIGVLVGEGPGREEADVGRPFVGPTGRELGRSMMEARLSREKVFIVNAMCCPATQNRTEGQLRKATAACRPALLKQLEKFDSKTPVFAMGKWAAFGLLGKDKGVMSGRGFVNKEWEIPRPQAEDATGVRDVAPGAPRVCGVRDGDAPRGGGRKPGVPGVLRGGKDQVGRGGGLRQPHPSVARGGLIVSWAPQYAFFANPFEWGTFEVDLDRFARMVRGELRPGPSLLLTTPNSKDVLRLVKTNPFITVDIETKPENRHEPWTGKDPMRAQLKTLGLGCDTWGLSHLWEGRSVERTMKAVLEDESITKVFHNGWWFDIPVLRRYGINPR